VDGRIGVPQGQDKVSGLIEHRDALLVFAPTGRPPAAESHNRAWKSEGEIVEDKICEEQGEPTTGKAGLPLDVRLVARLFYVIGGLCVLSGILLCSGAIKPREPYHILFGTVLLANGLTQGVYGLITGLLCLFGDWGLRQGSRLVWWFLVVSSVYYSILAVLMLPRYPVAATVIGAFQISLIAWLWFRRGLYSVRLAF
jgi:hypothetical protein